jgi:hypothetical protein
MPQLRAEEWINVAAFAWFTVLAWSRRSLDSVRRAKITALGAAGLAITLFVALALPAWIVPLAARTARDWAPYLLLFLCYRQGGLFITGWNTGFEARLERFDLKLVAPLLAWCGVHRVGSWILAYLEAAYLAYYVSLPLSMAALYLVGAASEAGRFWTVVLLAAYGSCNTLPFIQIRPPRMLAEKWTPPLPSSKVRAFNLWILRQGSIHANTFPSAHVAITTACALVLLEVAPLWVGLVFLWIALSVALGAVAGRYHYAADAILGVILAVAAFLAAVAVT